MRGCEMFSFLETIGLPSKFPRFDFIVFIIAGIYIEPASFIVMRMRDKILDATRERLFIL